MQNLNVIGKILIVVAMTTIVASCSGGGGGGGVGPSGGIDRLGVNAGTVDGFGSIFVNGVEFETDTADFDIDDDSSGSGQDDLSVGDVVAVVFDPAAPSVALTVVGDEAVEGPVDSVNVSTGELFVVGQTVLVDVNTSFDDANGVSSLADILAGNFVEVSGFIDGDGTIRATRIEKKAIAGEVEVHGIVSGRNATTFMINALTINYESAMIDDDFPGGTFSDGDLVEVKGTNFSGATLLATKVEPDGLGVGEGGVSNIDDIDEGEIEGFITRFVSATDFDVSGFPVTTNGGTVYAGGTAGDLGLNVKVEIDGAVSSGGVLVADNVEIRRTNDLRVTALVDDVSVGNSTLTLLDIVVRVDAETRVEDKSDADEEPFNLGHINAGDYVEVVGSTDAGPADILALRLEREDVPNVPGEDTELREIVDSVNRPFITVAGVIVDTTGADFQDQNDDTISADAFFAAVGPGDLVDVDGTETASTSMDADEVSLED